MTDYNEREPMDAKLCTQCAHSRMVGGHPACHDRRNMVQSLVDGRERCLFECEYLRSGQPYRGPDTCGPDALWFVPRSSREISSEVADRLAEQDAGMAAGFGAALELTKKAVK